MLIVTIIDAHSNQEHVRVDVTFENTESAVETINLFDWRMFGDKQIIARCVMKDDMQLFTLFSNCLHYSIAYYFYFHFTTHQTLQH